MCWLVSVGARQELFCELAHFIIDLADHVVHGTDGGLLDLACAFRHLLEDVESVEDVQRQGCDRLVDFLRARGSVVAFSLDEIYEPLCFGPAIAFHPLGLRHH